MSIFRTNFYGDPNIGMYGFATEKYCIIGMDQKENDKIQQALDVPQQISTATHTNFASLFIAGNSSGIAVSKILQDYELKELKKHFEVLVIDTDFSAIGNLLLINDKGVILSPLLRKHKDTIKKFFDVPVEITKVAGTVISGSAAFATNKGCLTHPRVKDDEKKIIEETLQVKSDIGTVNFGSPFVKSGIIANSKGLIVSDASSGPELGRITEVLGFI